MKRFSATEQMLSELHYNKNMKDVIAYLLNLNYLNILGDKSIAPDSICSSPGRIDTGKRITDEKGNTIKIKDKVIYFSFDQNSMEDTESEESINSNGLYIFGTINIGSNGIAVVSIDFEEKSSKLLITDNACENVYRYTDNEGNEITEKKVVIFDKNHEAQQYGMEKYVNGERVYEGKLNNITASLSDNSAAFTFDSEDNLRPVSLVRWILAGNIVQAQKTEGNGIDTTESIFVRLKEEIENRIEARKKSEYKRQRKFSKKNENKDKKSQE